MTFLINDCYHKMCSSCVNRRYNLGPAPCPYPNCSLILRKHKFREQTFPDIRVEREVDVRKRVHKVFNKRPEDFEDLRSYNDYLEEVEGITFDLLSSDKATREKAEKLLEEHSLINKRSIAENQLKSQHDKLNHERQAEFRKKQTLAARKAAAMEIQDQKEEAEEIKKARVRIYAEARNPEEARRRIAEETRAIKKRRARAREIARREIEEEFDAGPALKRRRVEDEAFDPLKGMEYVSEWFVVQDEYDVPWLEDLKHDEATLAGGFFLKQYYERSLFEAFAGLTVDIGAEKDKTEQAKSERGTDVVMTDVVVQEPVPA